jgi:phospholipase C
VVIIFQENRTPDNLFHDPVLIANRADIASSGLNSAGQTVPLLPISLGTDYDLSHAHSAFVRMYDGGKMDGANRIHVTCLPGAVNCPPPNAQFMYVQASDVSPYFQMAEQYTFGDRMFQTNEGPSFPAHQFILSGTSAPTATSNLFAGENPPGNAAGCIAPPSASVLMINPYGEEDISMYPCFDHPTLTDELEAKGVSWHYYTPAADFIWTAPTSIQHICGPNAAPPNATACTNPDWINNVIIYTTENPAPILTDITNNQLPAVSWVIPTDANSDHAGKTTNTGGPSWVTSIVNAIGNSPYWSDTAIIITWDDWGGWYDHVPPPAVINDGTSWGSGYVYGFRVPLIVISPYAKAVYISHVDHDFGSILHFIEEVYGLPSLGYADAYADDLSDCFDFSQTPLTFKTIQAPMDAKHFLTDRTPPEGPDND